MFSLYLYYYKLKNRVFRLNEEDYSKKNNIIMRYLWEKYGYIINRYSDKTGRDIPVKNIWFMWLQGIDKAPFVVQKSFENLNQNVPAEQSVVLITQENLYNFINFPDFIKEKYKKGIITKTHFSDLVRVKLLKEYGGIWMDSTVYTSKKIPNDLFKKKFFSINESPFAHGHQYVAKSKWMGFLMGGENTLIFDILDDLFMAYWKDHKKMIDYFLIDYFMELVFRNNYQVYKEITSLKPSTNSITLLQELLECKGNENKIIQILDSPSNIFNKLSYKRFICEEYKKML